MVAHPSDARPAASADGCSLVLLLQAEQLAATCRWFRRSASWSIRCHVATFRMGRPLLAARRRLLAAWASPPASSSAAACSPSAPTASWLEPRPSSSLLLTPLTGGSCLTKAASSSGSGGVGGKRRAQAGGALSSSSLCEVVGRYRGLRELELDVTQLSHSKQLLSMATQVGTSFHLPPTHTSTAPAASLLPACLPPV